MDEQQKIRQADTTFNTLCSMLDDIGWHYRKDEEERKIYTGARGDDLPMDIVIEVEAERQLTILMSFLPIEVPPEKRAVIAVAVSYINAHIVNGSFDYDYLNGRILFRITSSFLDSLIGPETFKYLLAVSCGTIDDYNDKLLKIVETDMTVLEIVNFLGN